MRPAIRNRTCSGVDAPAALEIADEVRVDGRTRRKPAKSDEMFGPRAHHEPTETKGTEGAARSKAHGRF